MSRTGDGRPVSAVSGGVGLAGLAGLAIWAAIGHHWRIDGPFAAMVAVAACGVPMVAWSLLVDRVHRRPSTGIDWDGPRRVWREVREISGTKIVGLWTTWAAIGAFYFTGRWYWQGEYLFAMQALAAMLPLLLAGSLVYVPWLDRRLRHPRDGAYHLGLWLIGRGGEADRRLMIEHARAWGVKGFFTAFMISCVPGNWLGSIDHDASTMLSDPLALASGLIALMFLVDVTFATVGYLLTMKPLDAHIRSANPFAAGWLAALICYPPFVLMTDGGPLDYRSNENSWSQLVAGHPALLALWGAVLVALTGIYAWATMAFGLRFSNLTDRGIITHGPYRLSKHPAYLAKNLFWWLSSLPFVAGGGGLAEAARNTIILGLVSGVYYWRARTEERHLMADPAYRAYAAWMAAHGPVPRAFAWALRRPAPALAAAE